MMRIRTLALLGSFGIFLSTWTTGVSAEPAGQSRGQAVAASPGGSPTEEAPLSPDMKAAFVALRQRQYDPAVRLFRKALEKEPSSARGYIGLAEAYQGLIDYKKFLEACDKAIGCGKDPRILATAHNMKGIALFAHAGNRQPPDKGDLGLAEREFRSALELDPAFHMVRYNLGMLQLRAGNDAAGIEWLRGYLKAEPNGTAARNAERTIENPRRARESYAPDFSVVTQDGEHLELEGLRGKVVVLDFWATWCGPCLETIPYLREFTKKYAKSPVVLISVSLDDNADDWRAMVASEKMTWPQVLDSRGTIVSAFKVGPIPTVVVIDGEGIIRQRVEGYSPFYGAMVEGATKNCLKRLAGDPSKPPRPRP